MRLFVYEYLTGGGLLAHAHAPEKLQSLAIEGGAMCAALIEDFAKIEGVRVTRLRDQRQATSQDRRQCFDVQTAAQHDEAFDRFAAEADWTVVIAPETGGILAALCRRAINVGGRLLGCSPGLVELASDKHATAEHLLRAGVPAPRGIPFSLGQPWPTDFPYPAIWKPRDGAGSHGLRFIEHRHTPVPIADRRPGRLEEFYPRPYRSPHAPREQYNHAERDDYGTAASVAVLCGRKLQMCLPPCAQLLDGEFHYLGGSLPLAPPLANRASQLARRAVESLPEPLGYLGVDLVLGKPDNGSDDVVIEINPRLTTSYIGLRAACRQNLADAMLAIAVGRPYRLSFRNDPMEFFAGGRRDWMRDEG